MGEPEEEVAEPEPVPEVVEEEEVVEEPKSQTFYGYGGQHYYDSRDQFARHEEILSGLHDEVNDLGFGEHSRRNDNQIREFGFHSGQNSFFDSDKDDDEEKPAKKSGGFIDFGDWGW